MRALLLIATVATVVVVVVVACGRPASTVSPADPVTQTPTPPSSPNAAGSDSGSDSGAGSAAASAKPSVPDLVATGTATLLATVPAWDVVPLANRLIVVDDGFLSVSAVDAATGAPAWRRVVHTKPLGRHTLHAGGTRALAWFGDKVHVLDAATGKPGASYPAAMNGTEWRDGGCGLDVVEGACARRCQCSFQVFDCATGAFRGKRYDKVYVEYLDLDGGRTAGCWGGGGDLLGAAGGAAIVSTEDHTTGRREKHGPTITAAIDLATGRERWRLAAAASAQPYASGHTTDGKTCWFSDGGGGPLTVVDCTTGGQLWTTAALPAGRRLVGEVVGHGLFELRGSVAVMLATRTGTLRWAVTLPPHTLAWTRGSDLPTDWDLRDVTSIAILDPGDGHTLATVPVTPGTSISRDGRGGFVLGTDTELIAHDSLGAVTGRVPLIRPGLIFGETLIVAKTATELIVLARGDLHVIARVPGAFSTVHVEGALGPNRLAAFAYDAKTVGQVTLFRIDR